MRHRHQLSVYRNRRPCTSDNHLGQYDSSTGNDPGSDTGGVYVLTTRRLTQTPEDDLLARVRDTFQTDVTVKYDWSDTGGNIFANPRVLLKTERDLSPAQVMILDIMLTGIPYA